MSGDNSEIIRARDVMHNNIVYVDGMATGKEAAALMRAEKVSSLLVKKRHADDAWGIVVVQDFIRGVIVAGRYSSEVNIYEIMTKPILTVAADMDIRYVARLMDRAGVRQAPVEEHGEIVGMVSLSALILEHELL